jgi:hypothetical protein
MTTGRESVSIATGRCGFAMTTGRQSVSKAIAITFTNSRQGCRGCKARLNLTWDIYKGTGMAEEEELLAFLVKLEFMNFEIKISEVVICVID